jgi:hypothetical protein
VNPFIVLLSTLRQKLLSNAVNNNKKFLVCLIFLKADRESLKAKARDIIAGGEAAFKEELPKAKPAPTIVTSAPPTKQAPATPTPKEEPAPKATPTTPVARPGYLHHSHFFLTFPSLGAGPAKTLRALKTNIYQQFDWDQGMISFYQKVKEFSQKFLYFFSTSNRETNLQINSKSRM